MKNLLVVLVLLGWQTSYAERVHLFFEVGCGNRIEYRRTQPDLPDGIYYVHSIPLGDSSDLLLESDGEGIRYIDDLPDSYLSCADRLMVPHLADRINRGEVQLSILVAAAGGGYEEHPVLMAAVLNRSGDRVAYHSPLATFAFDTHASVAGYHLDGAFAGATVTLEGREGNACYSPYLFTAEHPGTAYPEIYYRLHPRVGLVGRTLVSAEPNRAEGRIAAVTINGEPLIGYLDGLCLSSSGPAMAVAEQYTLVPKVGRPAAPSEESAPAPAPPPSRYISHRVNPGETLYGIGRQYGVSVSVLQQRNAIEGTTILVGQDLSIPVEEAGPTALPTVAPAAGTPATSPTVVVPGNEGSPSVSTYAVDAGRMHTVVPGQTLASIAMTYGYTKQRFMAFNGLGEGAVAQIGQRLRTTDCDCATAESESVTLQTTSEVALPSTYVEANYAQPTPVTVGSNTEAPPAYGGAAPGTPMRTASRPYESRQVHTVQDGESLYAISRRYRVSVAELRALNDIPDNEVIVPFQRLYLN